MPGVARLAVSPSDTAVRFLDDPETRKARWQWLASTQAALEARHEKR